MTKGEAKDRLREELRDYLVVSSYLFVCFSAVLFYGATVRGGSAPGLDLLGLAAAKALILGKFTLIGEAVGIGTRLKAGTLARYIMRKLLLLVLAPYVAVTELSRALGPGALRHLLTSPPDKEKPG
jgi:hypothetical protein